MSELDVATALDLLRHGEITVAGRLVDASNATLFCEIAQAGTEARCVYKPVAGERPLWDFPDGSLAGREVAAYAVSEAVGWGVVPPTVLRDGPFGPGMVQLWVDTDEEVHLVDVLAPAAVPADWRHVLDALGAGGEPVVLGHADDPRLRRMAVLDVVLNNADRKGGHVLPGPDGVVRGVDHGVCFHTDPKLRTVLWGWAGEPLTTDEVDVLAALREQLDGLLGADLLGLLDAAEVTACRRRVERLLREGNLPYPVEGWPAIPWPPF
ncbi:MAG TPA: SCO1664 family protein [Actinomycetes bacterium]|nr:SCO1664 family protein [Actinomycetes bacterium]